MSDRRERPWSQYAATTGETGSAGGQALIGALLPVLLAPHAPSTFWIGAVIASEGLFALVLPYVAGAATESMPPRLAKWFGARGVMLAVAMPFMAAALLLIPFRDSFWSLAGAAVIYFAALHLYSTPLRALLTDVTAERRWGRVQGVLGAAHLVGIGFGLIGGGVLFGFWEPLPFVVGAGLVVATTLVTLTAVRRLRRGTTHHDVDSARNRGDTRDRDRSRGAGDAASGHDRWRPRDELRFWRELIRDRAARRFLIANALWNAGTEGIRPYIFLFATVVVGITVQTAAIAMIGFLGAAILGSVLAGRLGDRIGRSRTLLIGAVITGVAMLPGLFIRDLTALIALLVPAGLGAAALVALPYPVFEDIVQDDDVGRTTGAFYISVGLARFVAPLLVGAAIDLAATWLPDERGYPAMWPVAGALILAGGAILGFTRRAGAEQSERAATP